MRLITALIIAAVVAAPVGAQQVANRAWTLSAGPMGFDGSGTGSTTVYGLSASQTLPWRWFAVEGSLGYAGMDEQFSGSLTHLGIAELQAQVQYPARLIRPYIGIGGGFIHYFTEAGGRRATEPSVALSAGLRAALTDSWGLQVDGRVRGWEFAHATDWAVNTTDQVTVGISRRF